MSEKARAENQQFFYALKMGVITIMLIAVFGMLIGFEYFGGMFSLLGLALLVLLFYAVR